MALQLGDIVPDFTQDSSEGPISFHQWVGDSWVVLFSHPADYTPVCTTELGTVASLKSEFERRNVKVIALSVDSAESHRGWINDINETQNTTVNYPIIADGDRKVSDLYGMIHPNSLNNLTVRSVFIIDPNKKLRLTISFDNVIAVAGAAKSNYTLLIFGLTLSVIMMVTLANAISAYLKEHKWVGWLGILSILWVAVDLIRDDFKLFF